MIRARSTRPVGSVRDREISTKRCRCLASVGNAITRSLDEVRPLDPPIQSPLLLLPRLVESDKSNQHIDISESLHRSYRKIAEAIEGSLDDCINCYVPCSATRYA